MHDLAGLWHLSDETGQFSAPITLPGDGISALNAADLIPDPYFGRNEYDLRWISDRDWLVSRTFEATDTNQTLVLSMLDTVADVSINGQSVLHADSMFRTFRADVSAARKVGENAIALHFRSAPREAAARAARQPFPVPYQADNCPIPHGNMLRKPECDFGWDWNIALAPFGLYGDIYLEPTQGRIADLIIYQDHSGSGVTLRITAHTDKMADGTPLTLSIGATQSSLSKARSDIASLQRISGELERLMTSAQRSQSEVERVADTLNTISLDLSMLNKRVSSNEEWISAINAFRQSTNSSINQLQAQLRALQNPAGG